jgi:hypothetical protein
MSTLVRENWQASNREFCVDLIALSAMNASYPAATVRACNFPTALQKILIALGANL